MEEKLYNLDTLKITTEDDKEFLEQILTTFLNNNREMVLKLEDAFTRESFIEIGEIAHKMLGSYKHLEIVSLFRPLTELESLTQGHKLNKDKVKELVQVVRLNSDKVFEGLEKEISEINSLN